MISSFVGAIAAIVVRSESIGCILTPEAAATLASAAVEKSEIVEAVCVPV
jgi:hypothetical protein